MEQVNEMFGKDIGGLIMEFENPWKERFEDCLIDIIEDQYHISFDEPNGAQCIHCDSRCSFVRDSYRFYGETHPLCFTCNLSNACAISESYQWCETCRHMSVNSPHYLGRHRDSKRRIWDR